MIFGVEFGTILPYLITLTFIAIFAFVFVWFRHSQRRAQEEYANLQKQFYESQQTNQSLLQESLHQFRTEFTQAMGTSGTEFRDQMRNLSEQLNTRMQETNSSLQKTQSAVGDRLDNAAKIISSLQHKLGDLEASNRQILDVGQGIKDLKDILKSPKLRGNMGEFFLEDLLRQILPAGSYEFQHHFRSGDAVDATIRVGDGIVSVDSKFPLETFQRLLKIPDDQVDAKKKERKAFLTTIKKHADAISKKYILPNEGTYDFAFMYIPAENVYYETIIRDDILDNESSLYSWLLERKVIPVSPNSLYAYLQVVILGLKGMRIQESAKHILKNLDRLQNELDRFRNDYSVLGKHLRNAGNSYESSTRRLEKFQDRYSQLCELSEDNIHQESTKAIPKPKDQPSLL